MNTYNVSELKENTYFNDEVYLDKSFLLLNSTIPVTVKLIEALREWNFDKVCSEGRQIDGFTKKDALKPAASPAAPAAAPRQAESQSIPLVFETLDSVDSINTDAPAVSIENTEALTHSEENRITMVQTIYNEYLTYVDQLFTKFATHRLLSLESISNKIKDLCVFVKENRRYVLRIQPSLEVRNTHFLVSHSLRSTVLAIVIGLQIRLPMSKLVELGVSCLLHEIGMIRLPPQLYMTDKPLTPTERKAIFTHPVISYNLLKDHAFPLNICLGALEHHEKENGEGYPRRLKGDKISIYAKIISVACSFEASTAPRHYKEAQNPYDGIIEMIRNTGKQYDETIVRVLLHSLSLYPIGSYVILSDKRIALVIDVNPENPKTPIVQIIGTGKDEDSAETVQTDENGVMVLRALTKEEAEPIVRRLQGQDSNEGNA